MSDSKPLILPTPNETAAAKTFYGNLTTRELLHYVDRSRADVCELASRLEIALGILENHYGVDHE